MRLTLQAFIILFGSIIGGVLAQPAMGYIRGAAAQTASYGPAALTNFLGLDSTIQFAIGYMAGAAEYLQALGGATGQGGSIVAAGTSTNININMTAKGTGIFQLGSGNGPQIASVDVGGVNADGALETLASPSGGSSLPAQVGNNHYGVKLRCGTNNRCQPMAAMTPSSSSQACQAGDMAWDTGYVYTCTASNTWKRAALSSF